MVDRVRIIMIGGMLPEETRMILDSSVSDLFELRGVVEHKDALKAQTEAAVLLLVVSPDAVGISTGKIYEYLASGRPILALAGPSPAADLVRALDAGVVVHPNDVRAIAGALTNLDAAWEKGTLMGAAPEAVQRFEARVLARELGLLFDQVVSAGGERRPHRASLEST